MEHNILPRPAPPSHACPTPPCIQSPYPITSPDTHRTHSYREITSLAEQDTRQISKEIGGQRGVGRCGGHKSHATVEETVMRPFRRRRRLRSTTY
ncbi:hypothetical protein E2C01_010760 [Portunus trituberculatus]|uniref:Uncharacterized protein n=1 Tax=Portunus trituberculatus TaxID=210409 RepID=A0A5B7D9A3_PORTR|nr:hypothetical protein [Portunus trituberculatus]